MFYLFSYSLPNTDWLSVVGPSSSELWKVNWEDLPPPKVCLSKVTCLEEKPLPQSSGYDPETQKNAPAKGPN